MNNMILKWKLGYWIGSRKYIPKRIRFFLENYWFKYMVYNFHTKVIDQNTIEVKYREITFKLKVRRHGKYDRDNYPFTQDSLGELIGPVPGYLRYYNPQVGDIIIDAGAYPGEFAVFLAKKIGQGGKVYCFEPDPFGAEWLKSNVELNGIENIEVIPKALGAEKSKTYTRLDDFINERSISRINFIKFDIEGDEMNAIDGGKLSLLNYSPRIAIASYHVVNGKPTHITIEEKLKKLNYTVRTEYPLHLTTYAWKKQAI